MKKNTAGKISVGASIFMVLAVCLFRKEKVFARDEIKKKQSYNGDNYKFNQ
ncbi:MAG: hypothetical protein K6A70_07355 [Erysipelotrichaceae bacterium]|nr:hypothetical protein [Erysipelotrichaceae bacterium]